MRYAPVLTCESLFEKKLASLPLCDPNQSEILCHKHGSSLLAFESCVVPGQLNVPARQAFVGAFQLQEISSQLLRISFLLSQYLLAGKFCKDK